MQNMEQLLIGKDRSKTNIKTFVQFSHFLKCSLLVFQLFLSKLLCHRQMHGRTIGAVFLRTSDVVLPPQWN